MMKKLESTLPNMVIALTAVTLISAGLLGIMQQLTKDPIARIEKKALEDGIKNVILGGQQGSLEVSKIDTIAKGNETYIVYHAIDGDKSLGCAVKTAVNGFSPNLTVLAGFAPDGRILGYEILKHAETPGLGAKADKWFQKDGKGNIIGKNPGSDKLTVTKDGGDIDAITASTITSRAFLKAINMEYNAIFGGDAHTGATTKHTVGSTDGDHHCKGKESKCEKACDGCCKDGKDGECCKKNEGKECKCKGAAKEQNEDETKGFTDAEETANK